jgi:hypothetical protein
VSGRWSRRRERFNAPFETGVVTCRRGVLRVPLLPHLRDAWRAACVPERCGRDELLFRGRRIHDVRQPLRGVALHARGVLLLFGDVRPLLLT